jgi:sugar-specific transcriptional regulator TrmB
MLDTLSNRPTPTNHILKYLKQLDFSEVEANLYLVLLKSGPKTVAELAQATNINRTAAYAYINSLLQKGIIAKVRGKRNKITANQPADLRHIVEQKANEVKNLEKTLPLIIKSLTTSIPQPDNNSNSEMKYYKGKTGVKTIYDEALQATELRSYFNAIDAEKIFPENIRLFKQAIDNNPYMEIYEIVEKSPESMQQIKYGYWPNRHVFKFLPDDIKLTSNDILIYDGKVAIINIGDKQNITGVILQNRDYYNNSKQLFDLLWRLLPELSAV